MRYAVQYMRSYGTFIFDAYSFEPKEGKIELKYSLGDEVEFVETLLLPGTNNTVSPSPLSPPSREGYEEMNAALFALHLIGGISYYKTCIPKKVEIRSGTLTEEQAAFWNSVYENGLGEFFYRNKIDFRGLVKFPSATSPSPLPPPSGRGEKLKRVLVPVGGGKDSVVTIELLKKAGYDITLFRMGHHPIIEEIAKVAGLPLLTVERHLSPALFKLNEEGALNGHVPITAYLSFLTIVIAKLYGFDAVVMSSERSASESNVEFMGMQINHQWSKSLECEQMLQRYIAENIDPDIAYFSLLRPLSELHIAKIFTEYPQYFGATTSCNANWKILGKKTPPPDPLPRGGGTRLLSPSGGGLGRGAAWCGHCPKCAFVFALFAAFLPKEKLLGTFGKNLFDDAALLPLYRELLGLEGMKPFECVGTPEETKAAMLLAHMRGDLDETAVMKMFLKESMPMIKNPDALIQEAFTPEKEHAIPPQFDSVLQRVMVSSDEP